MLGPPEGEEEVRLSYRQPPHVGIEGGKGRVNRRDWLCNCLADLWNRDVTGAGSQRFWFPDRPPGVSTIEWLCDTDYALYIGPYWDGRGNMSIPRDLLRQIINDMAGEWDLGTITCSYSCPCATSQTVSPSGGQESHPSRKFSF